MLNNQTKQKIKELWSTYESYNEYENIDKKRIDAIEDIKKIINSFIIGKSNVYDFKTSLDGYNKRNNLWGFTAVKGQMFFNQIVNSYNDNIDELTELLKTIITEPKDLNDALQRITKLENELQDGYNDAPDKRKVPKPSSIGYFLSYFWQIHNPEKWAILFTSMITAFKEIGIWNEKETQKEIYNQFYLLNEEIKAYLIKQTSAPINNWDIEHCFWDLYLKKNNISQNTTIHTNKESQSSAKAIEKVDVDLIKASFNIEDYLIPKISNLIQLGEDDTKSSAERGSLFEKNVAEVFKLLDFEVKEYGQGTGRNADAILRFREENIAFIVDAKAYVNGYDLGIDDRAIREYINNYSPILAKDGYKRIGFIIVSNSFKSDLDTFINDITWSTDVKRFMLLTSNALLHLLAYKTRYNIPLSQIIENIIKLGSVISEKEIIGIFEDI